MDFIPNSPEDESYYEPFEIFMGSSSTPSDTPEMSSPGGSSPASFFDDFSSPGSPPPTNRPVIPKSQKGKVVVKSELQPSFPWYNLEGREAYEAMQKFYKSKRIAKYECPYPGCHKQAKSKTDHIDHINRSHLLVDYYACDMCSHKLKALKELVRHKKNQHNDIRKSEPPRPEPQKQVEREPEGQIISAVVTPAEGNRGQQVSYHTPDTNLLQPGIVLTFTSVNEGLSFDFPATFVSSSLANITFNPPIMAPWDADPASPIAYLDFFVSSPLLATHPLFRWRNPRKEASDFNQTVFTHLPDFPYTDTEVMAALQAYPQATLNSIQGNYQFHGNFMENFAILDCPQTIEFLHKQYGVAINTPSAATGRNILHIAFKNDSVPLMKLGFKYKVSLLQLDSKNITPMKIFESLPANSDCKIFVKAMRTKGGKQLLLEEKFETLNLQETEKEIKKREKEQIEDFKLQALSNNFSNEAWNSFVAELEQHDFKLTKYGAREVLRMVVDHLELESTLKSTRSQGLLKGLTRILQISPSMAKALNEEGPDFVSQNIHLASFLSSLPERDESCFIGLEFASDLVELCPRFSDWTSFIEPKDEAQRKYLDEFFTTASPAKGLPSSNELSRRLQKKLSNKILSSLNVNPNEDASEERSLGMTIESVTRDLPATFGEERQKEILDQTEKLAMAFVHQSEQALRKALAERDEAKVRTLLEQRGRGIDRLVELHRDRRRRREARFNGKLEQVQQRLPQLEGEAKELIHSFLQHTGMLKDGVKTLEQIYTDLLESSRFLNPAKELCFIDSLIGELYNISISLVISGPISVGKSTIVNCIVGKNISPHRTETMTAIPVRYLHSPDLTEPVMLVPFATQLNVVIGKLKGLIEKNGLDYLKAVQRRTHLSALLDIIHQGLVIKDRYAGIQDIREASANIHDLFRLAVDDVFGDTLTVDLPLDWSQGLDTYLTVNINFPGLEVLSNLIEFSVVDTPGINEAGVKKLRLKDTIRDALRVCKYAAMVFTTTGFADTGLLSLRKMFHEIKNSLKTPVMAYVTFSEDIQGRDQADKKQNMCDTVTSETGERIFESDNIFMVLPKRKILGEQMLSFISEFKHKPELTGPSEAATLAEDWASYAGFGDNHEERIEYYKDLSLEKLVERSKKLVAASNMDLPLHHMVTESLKNGIPTSVSHAIRSAIQKVEPIVKKLASNITTEAVKGSLERGNNSLNQLVKLQEGLRTELGTKTQSVKAGIVQQGLGILKDIDQWKGPVTQDSPGFLAVYYRYLKSADDPRSLELLTSDKPFSFSSKHDAEKVLASTSMALRRAVEETFLTKNDRVAEELNSWGHSKKTEVRNVFMEIGRNYTQCVQLKPDEKVLSSMQLSLNTPEKLNLGYDPAVQLLIKKQLKKKKKAQDLLFMFPFLKAESKAYSVDPASVRQYLRDQSKTLVELTESNLSVQVDNLVTKTLKPFIEDNVNEVLRLKTMVQDTLLELETHKTQSQRPRKEMAERIDSTLKTSLLECQS